MVGVFDRGDGGEVLKSRVLSTSLVHAAEQITLPVGGHRLQGAFVAKDTFGQGAELQFAEHFQDAFAVRGVQVKGFVINRHRGIGQDGGQLAAHARLLGVFPHPLPQLALDLVSVLQDPFHTAVLLDELDGGLLPHTGDAGDVVHGIAHQPQDVDDLFRALQAPPGADLLGSQHFVGVALAARFVHQHLVGDQLAEVLVRGHHVGGVPVLLGMPRQGADHVVRLVPVAFQDGDVEALDDAADVGDVRGDVVRHLLPVRLVLRVFQVPLGGLGGVEDHGDVGGLLLLDQVQQGEREAECRAGVEAPAVDPRVLDEAEVRAVDQRVGIEQEEALVLLGGVFGRGHGGKLAPGLSVPSRSPPSPCGPRPAGWCGRSRPSNRRGCASWGGSRWCPRGTR